MKPHYQIPIQECGDPLVPIPLNHFSIVNPHPYAALGAPYGAHSPYFLRQTVLERLIQAQVYLQDIQPGWQIQIFDAYRPLAVQQFMVDHTYDQLLRAQNLDPQTLSVPEQQQLMAQVYQFWAPPSHAPATPPPHSTGAAIDITLIDEQQQPIPMGSEIDELSERSYPNHFASHTEPSGQRYHQHRTHLADIMHRAGFCQHPNEWWHFSYGDQLWAWSLRQRQLSQSEPGPVAHYGAVTEAVSPTESQQSLFQA
ncbi:MAG: M15 family metallopeptidase [Cyanobacteria bacterium P01_F01_bin.4]